MNLSRKHYIAFGVAALICLVVVFWAIRDNTSVVDIDKQAEKAVEERENEEKRMQEEIEEVAGVAIPTKEEVERVVGVTDNQMLYEELINKEYGKKKGQYIFDAYVRDELPSTGDSPKTKQVKEALIIQAFNDNAYRTEVDVLHGTFELTFPYSTMEPGFKELNEKLSIGYLNSIVLNDSSKKDNIPRINLFATVFVNETLSVNEFEELLATNELVVANNTAIPFNRYVREASKKAGADNPYNTAGFKELVYVNPSNPVYREGYKKDAKIYAGTVVSVPYVVELENVNVQQAKELDVQIGSVNFMLNQVDSGSDLIYQLE